ncbi:MAG: hypothetical protein WBA10_11435 [Elainellaceae cyanobacterium]
MGLLATVIQEPAQANAVNYDGDTPLLSSHPNGVQSVSLTPALASDPGASNLGASTSGRDDLLTLALPKLAKSGHAGALAAAPFEPLMTSEPLVTRSVSLAADVELSAEGSDAPLAFQSLAAEADEIKLQPLQAPAQPTGAIAAAVETPTHPTYQVITTPPPTPVIAIGATEVAAGQPSFDPAERFVYHSSAPSSRPSLAGIEIIDAIPSGGTPVDIEAVAPAIAPMLAQTAAPTRALPAPLGTPARDSAVAQRSGSPSAAPSAVSSTATSNRAADLANPNQALTEPIVTLQSAFLYQDDDLSARGRLTAIYPITSYLIVGGSIDLTEGDAFIDSELEGVNINELYVTVAPPSIPNLRFTLGQIDLTSYFDRNSFAKDAVTHFFNPIFQTNPALATSGIGSRQGILANWAVTDDVRLAVSGFSSDRSISDFELDAVAAELGVRVGNGIIRGTYVNSRDAGTDDGPADIFSLNRGGGEFGIQEGDREEAFGLNAEYFIPEINLGLFARFGHYNNRDADFDANTVSGGANLLDVFMARDRLGLAYGESLSGGDDEGVDNADALELFYDLPIRRNLRAGVTLQQRNDFSETVVGFRIRNDFNILP